MRRKPVAHKTNQDINNDQLKLDVFGTTNLNEVIVLLHDFYLQASSKHYVDSPPTLKKYAEECISSNSLKYEAFKLSAKDMVDYYLCVH